MCAGLDPPVLAEVHKTIKNTQCIKPLPLECMIVNIGKNKSISGTIRPINICACAVFTLRQCIQKGGHSRWSQMDFVGLIDEGWGSELDGVFQHVGHRVHATSIL